MQQYPKQQFVDLFFCLIQLQEVFKSRLWCCRHLVFNNVAHAQTNCTYVPSTELYYISGDRSLDDLVSAKTWRISEPVTSLVPHFYVLSWGYSLTAARVTAGDMKQPPWF